MASNGGTVLNSAAAGSHADGALTSGQELSGSSPGWPLGQAPAEHGWPASKGLEVGGLRSIAPTFCGMKFYLGTHHATQRWFDYGIPLFVSRRVLGPRKRLPEAREGWALDSGGFTELNLYGEWRTTEDEYIADVLRFQDEIGELEWVAPMDWMCEPFVLAKTGRTLEAHQSHTVVNFLRLRERLGALVVPVLQGWTVDDYRRCWGHYRDVGIDLEDEPLVGLGSVCRRQNTAEAGEIVRALAPLRLHYFGAKLTGLESFGDALTSADSMAWSYRARRSPPLPGCTHKSCANCVRFAMRWRNRVLERLSQTRLEFA